MSALAALRKAARTVSLVMLAALILTPLLQILMRGVFNVPLAGAEELAKYFLICLVLIGASCVSAEGGQIRMEEFQAVLPPGVRRPLRILIALSAVGVFSLLLLASVVTVIRNVHSVTPVLEMPFPLSLPRWSLVPRFFCSSQSLRCFRRGRAGSIQPSRRCSVKPLWTGSS